MDELGRAMDDDEAATCEYDIEGERSVCSGGTPFLVGDAETGVLGPGHAGVFKYDKDGEPVTVFTFHYYVSRSPPKFTMSIFHSDPSPLGSPRRRRSQTRREASLLRQKRLARPSLRLRRTGSERSSDSV